MPVYFEEPNIVEVVDKADELVWFSSLKRCTRTVMVRTSLSNANFMFKIANPEPRYR